MECSGIRERTGCVATARRRHSAQSLSARLAGRAGDIQPNDEMALAFSSPTGLLVPVSVPVPNDSSCCRCACLPRERFAFAALMPRELFRRPARGIRRCTYSYSSQNNTSFASF